MLRSNYSIAILERYADIAPFVPHAVASADSDKNALGFFPGKVFSEFAQKEELLIAIEVRPAGPTYVGHLLYDARLPRAKVLQIFVAREMRKGGIAKMLLDRLKEHLTEHMFISVYASVAEDLVDANSFWHRNGFYVQRARAGGKTRGRTILVRCHELDSPQLFAKSGISASNPLGLDVGLQGEKPIYLLDLNVLFDLGPRRARNESALDLFRAERHGSCQLALSSELRDELTRTAKSAPHSDPMHAWAAIFITFPVPTGLDESLLRELGNLVFYKRAQHGNLTHNDLSDLKHLATAIHHRLAGFITNDSAVLDAAGALATRYGIHVTSPLAFQGPDEMALPDESFETQNVQTLSLSALTQEDEAELRSFLLRVGVSDHDVMTTWGAVDSNRRACARWAVWSNEELVGYLACPSHVVGSATVGRIAVDETSPLSRGAALVLLTKLLDHASEAAPESVRLELPPRQAAVREIASLLGFARSDDGTVLSKLVFNRIVTVDNWERCRNELLTACQLRLPDRAPPVKSVDQQIELFRSDGNRVFIPLMALESHLSPALFCLPGRQAVITPIQRIFAERLLAHSGQGSLLPRARASLYAEKHYVSAERTLKFFARGTVILFYESSKDHGASAVVAVARVQRAYLKPSDTIDRGDLDPSVLDFGTLGAIGNSKSKTVTAFDNVMLLPTKVPLSTLKQLGCGDANQLISTRPISAEQLRQILLQGLRDA
jgi:GNAT superfamily N-acetyltransferase